MSIVPAARPIAFVLTADRARAEAFYADVLGMAEVARDDFATTYALGGEAVLRLTPVAGHVPGQHTVLGWAVPDMAEAMASLRDKGVEFKVYDGFGQDDEGVWTAPGGGVKVAWFDDPDGNNLSLTAFG
ncbi:MAG TPA: VOC family protein [Novosphingobium sp.]|nr:VOC family protein [Novosphingobium sp.]